MSMKLRLINPSRRNSNVFNMKFFVNNLGMYLNIPLAIPTLAALTPKDVEINCTDENIEDIDFDEKVDLVALTSTTQNIIRAYEISDTFRKKGIKKVIIGGMHASILPQEAIQHADCVVIGEAETIWGGIIEDFKKGKLKRFYSSQMHPPLDKSPKPKWNVLKDKYIFGVIQASRGCPFDCNYCSVKTFFGEEIRLKNIEQIIEEINILPRYSKIKFGPFRYDIPRTLFFVDDNIVSNFSFAKRLFKSLIPLKLPSILVQATINIAKDEELLSLMKKAGVEGIYIGFESASQDSLDNFEKKINKVEEYEKSIKIINFFGIKVIGSFIVGSDGDDERIFEKTADFIKKNKIYVSAIWILTPYPGTRLFSKLESEGRILHKNWNLYDSKHVVFKPKHMSAETLQNGYYWLYQNIYSDETIVEKISSITSTKKTSFSSFLLKEKLCILFFILKLLLSTQYKSLLIAIMREIVLKNKPVDYPAMFGYLSYKDFAYSFPKTSSLSRVRH